MLSAGLADMLHTEVPWGTFFTLAAAVLAMLHMLARWTTGTGRR